LLNSFDLTKKAGHYTPAPGIDEGVTSGSVITAPGSCDDTLPNTATIPAPGPYTVS